MAKSSEDSEETSLTNARAGLLSHPFPQKGSFPLRDPGPVPSWWASSGPPALGNVRCSSLPAFSLRPQSQSFPVSPSSRRMSSAPKAAETNDARPAPPSGSPPFSEGCKSAEEQHMGRNEAPDTPDHRESTSGRMGKHFAEMTLSTDQEKWPLALPITRLNQHVKLQEQPDSSMSHPTTGKDSVPQNVTKRKRERECLSLSKNHRLLSKPTSPLSPTIINSTHLLFKQNLHSYCTLSFLLPHPSTLASRLLLDLLNCPFTKVVGEIVGQQEG